MTTPEAFLEATAPMLEGAPPDMLEGEVLPVHRMADILGSEDPEEQERMLGEHEAAVAEVTGALENYIDEHYESFNSSIAFFSEMIVKIEAAKDAVTSVKASIDSAASLLNPRYDELLDRRRRWARCIVRGQLLSEMSACIRAEVRAVQLQAQGNAVGAVKNLVKYRRKAARIAEEGVRSVEPLVSRVDARLAALPLSETRELLNAIFATSSSASTRRVDSVDLSMLPTPAAVDDVCRRHFASATERSPELRLAARVRAVHLCGQSQRLLDALTRDAPSSEVAPWATRIVDAAAERSASCDSAAARVESFVEATTAAVEGALARAAAVALFGACCDLPLLHGIVTAGTIDNPEQWALEEWVNDSIAVVAREAVATASNRTSARGADHQAAMAKLTQAFLDAPTATSGGASGTLASLLRDIDTVEEAIASTSANAVLADAVEDCAKILRTAAHEAALNDASHRVATVLQRWTLRPLWAAMQAQLARVVEALLGDGNDGRVAVTDRTRSTGHRLGASASKDGRTSPVPGGPAQPTTSQRVTPSLDGLPSLLGHKAANGVPKFIDALGTVSTTTLEGAARSLSSATADQDAQAQSGFSLLASRLNVQPRAELAVDVLPAAQRFLDRVRRLPGLLLATKWGEDDSTSDPSGTSLDASSLEASIRYGIDRFARTIAADVLARLETLAAASATQGDGATAPMLPCGFDVSSGPPLLALTLAANEALHDLWPLRKALPDLAERPTRKAAEHVVEFAAMHAKHALEMAARGSFGWEAVKDDLDLAFSHAPTPDWSQITMADSAGGIDGLTCRSAQGPLDRRVSSVYQQLSESHAAGTASRSPRSGASTPPPPNPHGSPMMSADVRSRLLPTHAVVSQIACIAHSLEWLATRFLQFVQKRRNVDTLGSPVPCRGASIAPTGDAKRDHGIATYTQLGCVAQSALAVIAADVKLVTCIHMHEMRDVSYNIACEGSESSSFVTRLTGHLKRLIAAVEPHVPPSKLRYVAVAAANPAAELFVQEASHLRDKRITPAGARQIAIDLRTLGRVLSGASSADARLASEIDSALNRARTYFSVMGPDRAGLVRDIAARGMHRSFSQVELENLIALACRDARDNSAYEMIEELRKFLASSQSETASSGAPAASLAQSIAALRSTITTRQEKQAVAKPSSPAKASRVNQPHSPASPEAPPPPAPVRQTQPTSSASPGPPSGPPPAAASSPSKPAPPSPPPTAAAPAAADDDGEAEEEEEYWDEEEEEEGDWEEEEEEEEVR